MRKALYPPQGGQKGIQYSRSFCKVTSMQISPKLYFIAFNIFTRGQMHQSVAKTASEGILAIRLHQNKLFWNRLTSPHELLFLWGNISSHLPMQGPCGPGKIVRCVSGYYRYLRTNSLSNRSQHQTS